MKTRLLALALTVLLLTGSAGIAVFANSAQTHWNGTDASGAVIVDGDCPIVVEREIPAVDLQEFPSNLLCFHHRISRVFGELEVRINTPYHLLENSLGEFQKTSDGYRLTLDHLPPYTELEFELSESEDPEQKSVWKKVFIGFIWAFIMWYIVFPILAVIILAVVIVKIFKAIRRRRKKRLAQRAEPQNPTPDQSENKDP